LRGHNRQAAHFRFDYASYFPYGGQYGFRSMQKKNQKAKKKHTQNGKDIEFEYN
jgi:hypothetical protein